MAWVGKERNGRKNVGFVDGDDKQRTIRLGKVTMKQANAFKVKVEMLAAPRLGCGIDDETARWLASLPDDVYEKLAAVGLVQPRMSMRLAEFIDGYVKARDDVKATTAITYAQARRHLVTFFGPDKPLRDITEGDAELWRLHLIREGLADASVRKFSGIAKQFFRMAVKRKLVPSNPFTELKSSAKGNEKRQYFVSLEDTQKVIEACPDSQWRLIVALCRYGGVRCPSEVLPLTWGDVHWDQSRITIHSPKTEHHEGGESRLIPLFPELLPYLQEVYDEAVENAVVNGGAVPGTDHLITRYRQKNGNLRTQFARIIRRAGLKPWDKPFQNLRSTRETELVNAGWPEHVVCAWIGNSKVVARRHYLQLRDADFERAARVPTGTNASAENPTEYPAKSGENASYPASDQDPENAVFRGVTGDSKSLQNKHLGDEGIEPSTAALRVRCSTN